MSLSVFRSSSHNNGPAPRPQQPPPHGRHRRAFSDSESVRHSFTLSTVAPSVVWCSDRTRPTTIGGHKHTLSGGSALLATNAAALAELHPADLNARGRGGSHADGHARPAPSLVPQHCPAAAVDGAAPPSNKNNALPPGRASCPDKQRQPWDLVAVPGARRHRVACLAARRRRDRGECSDAQFRKAVLASAARCGGVDDPFAKEHFVDVVAAAAAWEHEMVLAAEETDDECDDDVLGTCRGGWLRRCNAVPDLLAAARWEAAELRQQQGAEEEDFSDCSSDEGEFCFHGDDEDEYCRYNRFHRHLTAPNDGDASDSDDEGQLMLV